mmetsp:Transcript_121242/g.377426  ORF Transcript_121242/g.377426 Transcript_121242/m.377426 type:complete len:204 (-) Transcript_121242:25-636(-)
MEPPLASGRGSHNGRPRSSESRRSRGSSVPSTHLSRASRASRADPHTSPSRTQRLGDDGSLPHAARLALSGLPGYSGFVPGKAARNVYGSTFSVANERATQELDMSRSGLLPPRPGRAIGPAPGSSIPGYMGFVPGRYSDNVMGQTAARGAETAWMFKAHQAEERERRLESYRRGERPPTGGLDHSGYRSLGAPIGVDSGPLR